jgi:hypothetical protein
MAHLNNQRIRKTQPRTFIEEASKEKGDTINRMIICEENQAGIKPLLPAPHVGPRRYPRAEPVALTVQASLHSPTGKARGTLPFGLLDHN